MEITRIINGKEIRGILVPPKKATKKPSIRPKPQKPIYGSRVPKILEGK